MSCQRTSTSDSIAVASTAYNSLKNQSNYVGWTYSGTSQRTTGGTSSNAKTQLESWYNSNIGNNSNYSSKVADGKYCNDRNARSGSTWTINGSTFYYAAYDRNSKGAPTLNCSSEDIYILKVGLITADEVIYAGGRKANNTAYYLYNGQNYWTMSPCHWWYSSDSYAVVFRVDSNGNLNDWAVHGSIGLRPVINLRSDITFSGGSGTQSSPYIVN